MQLVSRPKYGTDGTHRIMPAVETCRRVGPYMERIGVTRVSDTTGLDSLGMPIFSAIRPTDAGLDGISVYNGKGLTKAESKAGAMMEAIERHNAEKWLGDVQCGTREEILEANRNVRVMDPSLMVIQQQGHYSDDTVLEWGEGWDFGRNEPILLPLAMIVAPYRGHGERIWYSSSNGLASGNTMEEALCHGLAELIERDAYTIALVRAQLAPRVATFVEGIVSGEQQPAPAIDRSLFPSIRLDSLPPLVRRLLRGAERDGTEVWLRDITSDLGVPAFVASLRRWEADGSEFAAGGFGCHPNSTIAVVRAITEAAQGRNVQIQGAREDAQAVGTSHKAAERVLWCQDSERTIDFTDVPTYVHDDILDDIRFMLAQLDRAGVTEIYGADLTYPDIPACVLRLIVPDMESWFLRDFAADQSRLGPRARRYLGLQPVGA
jgi:ribosomal protein S12 methylthiotransferase accessory factor